MNAIGRLHAIVAGRSSLYRSSMIGAPRTSWFPHVLMTAVFLAAYPLHAADPLAHNRENGTYPNRPGATMADFEADARACSTLAQKTTAPQTFMGAGLPGVLVGTFAAAMQKAPLVQKNADRCMHVRGWRDIFLTAAEGKSLDDLARKDVKAALAPLIGADPPALGIVGYAWANDYAEPHPLPEPAP